MPSASTCCFTRAGSWAQTILCLHAVGTSSAWSGRRDEAERLAGLLTTSTLSAPALPDTGACNLLAWKRRAPQG